MKKSLIVLITGAFFATAGVAVAADKPVMLSANQMEAVTAGGVADATAIAQALGAYFATTNTETQTITQATNILPIAAGQLSWVFSSASASSAASAQ